MTNDESTPVICCIYILKSVYGVKRQFKGSQKLSPPPIRASEKSEKNRAKQGEYW